MTHCVHFGTCGGCAVNFAEIDKLAVLRRALAQAGYPDAQLNPLVEVPLGTRRRVDLALWRISGGVELGLHKARSDDVVDMTECALLEPSLLLLIAPLRLLARRLDGLRKAGSIIVNMLDDGADVLLRLDAALTLTDRAKILEFAKNHHVRRVSAAQDEGEPETIVMLAPPVMRFAGTAVTPPPGAFLQPSQGGEAAIIAAVLAGLPKLKGKARIIELFAGIGTLSFDLAAHAAVEAYEGAPEAVAALDQAIRMNNFAGRMKVETRNLARRPLQPKEMSGRAALVLDPPYMGAGRQMPFIASSGIPRIIYVSCNPDALRQDAFVLQRAGYALTGVTPIDQFPFSENLESVAVFQKGK